MLFIQTDIMKIYNHYMICYILNILNFLKHLHGRQMLRTVVMYKLLTPMKSTSQ